MPADTGERKAVEQFVAKVDPEKPPGSHVLRLLLHPDGGRADRVLAERRLEGTARQRIKLLDADDRDIAATEFLPPLLEFVGDLAGAERGSNTKGKTTTN